MLKSCGARVCWQARACGACALARARGSSTYARAPQVATGSIKRVTPRRRVPRSEREKRAPVLSRCCAMSLGEKAMPARQVKECGRKARPDQREGNEGRWRRERAMPADGDAVTNSVAAVR